MPTENWLTVKFVHHNIKPKPNPSCEVAQLAVIAYA